MTNHVAFDRFIDALTGHGKRVTGTGTQRKAQCPAHEDREPSLSITGIEGQILVRCHAGCDTTDILTALNLGLPDLYDNPKGTTYQYDNGRTKYRTPDKKFWQKGTHNPPELFKLGKVKEAINNGQTVYVVEGEKDVLAIESLGGVATCNPQGAGKWSEIDPTPLYGGTIIIVADQDEPGRKHATDVHTSLHGHASTLVVAPAEGKDAADHIAAGHQLKDFQPVEIELVEPARRHVVLTRASDIKPRPVIWLWEHRLALGTLGLLAGREGLGKSTLAYWAAARITRGELPGKHHDTPQSVLVCATEDSWEHTIVPRLMATGADLGRVSRVEVMTALGVHTNLSLPKDLDELQQAAEQEDAALLLLDPLISRLGNLDTHRDAEVRQALEPLVAIADQTGMAILGIIHHNKSGSSDALQLVMGSKAFTAVARSVHTVIPDPDDETNRVRLFGTPKNNLGRDDLPTLSYTIESHPIDTDEGTAWTGRLEWGEEQERSIHDAIRSATDSNEDRTATGEAADWLSDYLADNGGQVKSADAKRAGKAVGHSETALKRAAKKLRLTVSSTGYPRITWWETPSRVTVGSTPGESELTELTDPTEVEKPRATQLGQLGQSDHAPARDDPTRQPSSNGHTGNPELALIIADLGGICGTCNRFTCDCEKTP